MKIFSIFLVYDLNVSINFQSYIFVYITDVKMIWFPKNFHVHLSFVGCFVLSCSVSFCLTVSVCLLYKSSRLLPPCFCNCSSPLKTELERGGRQVCLVWVFDLCCYGEFPPKQITVTELLDITKEPVYFQEMQKSFSQELSYTNTCTKKKNSRSLQYPKTKNRI